MGKSGGKGISYFGLVAMGIGCMLGTSWLLLTGTWLETAGGHRHSGLHTLPAAAA